MNIVLTAFLLANLALLAVGDTVTTWKGDKTGAYCTGAAACDYGKARCSALQMNDCKCQDNTLGVPAKDTKATGLKSFKGYCNSPSIDGRAINATDRARCLSCAERVCDGTEAPKCKTPCGMTVCVNGRVETKVMDACPSNHQKNVAKCCMWGHIDPSYCACVKGRNLDVNAAAMKALGCAGKKGGAGVCRNASWTIGPCKKRGPFRPFGGLIKKPTTGPLNPVGGEHKECVVDQKPPGSKFTCAQQAGWGKCNEQWMKGYCCKSCVGKR